MVTLDDLRKYQTELESEFGSGTTVAYANVSMGQLSVGWQYGGATVQGHLFVYNPVDDSLIREDVVKWVAKRKKDEK